MLCCIIIGGNLRVYPHTIQYDDDSDRGDDGEVSGCGRRRTHADLRANAMQAIDDNGPVRMGCGIHCNLA